MKRLIPLLTFLLFLPVADCVRCQFTRTDGTKVLTNNCYSCTQAYNGCTDCEVGYERPDKKCLRCPGGQYSPGGIALCSKCPAGTFSPSVSANCTECPGGTFSAEESSGCTPCLPGQYSNANISATGCISCPAGTYAPVPGWNSSDCLECPEGSYSLPGSSSCSFCGAGQLSVPGSSKCIDVCPAAQYWDSKDNSCKSCLKGTYLGSTSCLACPAGTFSSVDGLTGCNKCPAGTWSAAGATSCTLCEAGTYSPTPGARSSSRCFSCPEGEYSKKGATSCEICAAGSYSKEKSESCAFCPAGTSSPLPGGSFASCRNCSEGYYANEGSAACKRCSSGTYSLTGAGGCTICPRGESSNPGATTCFPIPQTESTNEVTTVSTALVSKVGSSLCVGSPMFVSVGLTMKIVQNMRYMKLNVTYELESAFKTWENNAIAPNPPESWESHSGQLPEGFARYNMRSNFLVNYWPDLLTIMISTTLFVMLRFLKHFLKKNLQQRKIVSVVLDFFILASCNFTVIQIYSSFDSIIFYSILDLRFSGFSSGFSSFSSVLGIFLVIFAVGMVSLNFWIVHKYVKLKKLKTDLFDNFIKKFEVIEVIYKDFKDNSLFKLSFFAVMITRAMLFSLIIAAFDNTPLFQAILFVIINVAMLAFLVLKSPFKELYDELVQYFYEIIIFISYLCVLILVISERTNKDHAKMRQNVGRCIIALNSILLLGVLAFMSIDIYRKIIEIYEAWKDSKQPQSEPFNETKYNETTAQFLGHNMTTVEEEISKKGDYQAVVQNVNVKKINAKKVQLSQVVPISQPKPRQTLEEKMKAIENEIREQMAKKKASQGLSQQDVDRNLGSPSSEATHHVTSDVSRGQDTKKAISLGLSQQDVDINLHSPSKEKISPAGQYVKVANTDRSNMNEINLNSPSQEKFSSQRQYVKVPNKIGTDPSNKLGSLLQEKISPGIKYVQVPNNITTDPPNVDDIHLHSLSQEKTSPERQYVKVPNKIATGPSNMDDINLHSLSKEKILPQRKYVQVPTPSNVDDINLDSPSQEKGIENVKVPNKTATDQPKVDEKNIGSLSQEKISSQRQYVKVPNKIATDPPKMDDIFLDSLSPEKISPGRKSVKFSNRIATDTSNLDNINLDSPLQEKILPERKHIKFSNKIATDPPNLDYVNLHSPSKEDISPQRKYEKVPNSDLSYLNDINLGSPSQEKFSSQRKYVQAPNKLASDSPNAEMELSSYYFKTSFSQYDNQLRRKSDQTSLNLVSLEPSFNDWNDHSPYYNSQFVYPRQSSMKSIHEENEEIGEKQFTGPEAPEFFKLKRKSTVGKKIFEKNFGEK